MLHKNTRHNLLVSTEDAAIQRIMIKTRPGYWVDTNQPIILPFSIHTSIYNDKAGNIKIAALLNLIQSNTVGKKTILICEGAHIHSLSLKYNNDIDKTLNICHFDANALSKRFEQEFKEFEVVFWNDFVTNDPSYTYFKNQINFLYSTNEIFREKVKSDAEKTYNADRSLEYPNKFLYVQKTELDILEQCAYFLVASKKGYKYEFYPGKRNDSVDFIHLNNNSQLNRINVTLRSPKNLE